MIIEEFRYSLYFTNAVGDILINQGNPNQIAEGINTATTWGHNQTENHLKIVTSISSFNPSKDKSVQFKYESVFNLGDSILSFADYGSEALKAQLTELLFRHQVHLNQFLYKMYQETERIFPLPPFPISLKYCYDFVLAELNRQAATNN